MLADVQKIAGRLRKTRGKRESRIVDLLFDLVAVFFPKIRVFPSAPRKWTFPIEGQ
jgi:hypothetical protein